MTEPTPDVDALFGRLVVEQGLATSEQVLECLSLKADLIAAGASPLPKLGELLVKKGILTLGQFQRTMTQSRLEAPVPGRALTTSEKTDLPLEAAEAAKDPANLFGKYVRTAKLGSGGMGEVWKSWDKELRRWVAVKFLKYDSEDELARFKREAQTSGKLGHPNIAAIHEIGETGGKHFISMQFVEGRTLLTFPRDDLRLLVELIRDAALAVHAAHEQGVIHRDLKPENLMVEGKPKPRAKTTRRRPGASRASGLRIYVMDFGLAKSIKMSSVSISGMILGTPAYMPPEQARGHLHEIDPRSDVYSLGATLYEILTDRPPFVSKDAYEILRMVVEEEPARLRRVNPKVDPELEAIVLKCLEKDPARRYPSALSLAEDLSRWLDGEPIEARPPSVLYRARKLASRYRALAAGGLAALVMLGVLSVLGYRWRARAQEADRRRIREAQARDRARSFLESGRRQIEQLRLRLKDPKYTAAQVSTLTQSAVGEFMKALRESEDSPEAWLGIGEAYLLARDDRALQAIEKAIHAAPELGLAYLDRARYLMVNYDAMRHDFENAVLRESAEAKRLREEIEADLERAERYAQDNAQRFLAQGFMALGRGEYAAAVAKLTEYVNLVPEDDRALFGLGRAYQLSGRYKEAEAAYTRGLSCDAREPALLINRSAARVELGRFDEALADTDRAIEIDPALAEAWLVRADVHRHKSDYEGALADFKLALEIHPHHAAALMNRGVMRAEHGDLAGAVEDFTLLLNRHPNLTNALRDRGFALQRMKEYARSIEDFSAVLRLEPGNAEAYFQRGTSRYFMGEIDRAISDLTEAIRLNPEYKEALYNRGIARHDKNDMKGALEDWTEVIRIDPKYEPAYVSRAAFRTTAQDLDGALADWTEAGRLVPGDVRAWRGRGAIRQSKGDLEGAVEDYGKVLELDPKDYLVRAQRGLLRERLVQTHADQTEKLLRGAAADFEEALKLAPPNWESRNQALAALERVRTALKPFDPKK